MDYKASAQGVLEAIGGRDNIVSAAHCATRLRLVIADNGKIDKEKLENVDGVKGVFEASGQLQIIFGTGTVNKVYDEFIALAGIEGGSKEDVKKAAASRQNIFLRLIKTLGDVFVPILPAIVASGLLMGILEGLTNAIPGMKDSNWYTFFHLMSSAALTFLPILIAVSSARAFGGNLFLGAVVGMIMIHPDLVNAWSGEAVNEAPVLFSIGAYSVRLVGYQGHVIPVIISVWVMCFIEKKLLENAMDFALIESAPRSGKLACRRFSGDRMVAVCSPKDPLAKEQGVTLAQLMTKPLLLREKSSGTRDLFDSVARSHNLTAEPMWESVNTQALIEAVAMGLGVSVLPWRLVQDSVGRGLLQVVPVQNAVFRRDFNILYHPDKYQTKPARDFLALCQEAGDDLEE